MNVNDLLRIPDSIIRVLKIEADTAVVIDCLKGTMPNRMKIEELEQLSACTEEELYQASGRQRVNVDDLDAEQKSVMYHRYTIIAPILTAVGDRARQAARIEEAAEAAKVSKRTVKRYLCAYLSYGDMLALAPEKKDAKRELTTDEKNFRWALNKYYYSQYRYSLQTAYTLLLKEKYCDATGKLVDKYPTINQFRYFFRKTKKMQTYYISRDGIKDYQRNHRPLLGDGVQEFAPAVGTAMLDATVCDIYLVDEAGNLIGRPVLTACIEAHSSLCMAYMLSWEGGTYSLRGLMTNILADKKEWCRKKGVFIEGPEWDTKELPGRFICDMGGEYKSETFAQITELGVMVTNLPSFRPEMKGPVEKFFGLIQDSFKEYLKHKGVVEPDFQQRGAHDYRKDACLTMDIFERIVLKCIIYYNSERVLENFPYTEEMIAAGVKPYANAVFAWGKHLPGACLLDVDLETVLHTILPRTTGRFARNGLIVNRMRYRNRDYVERFLSGGECVCAYNPDDVSIVWLIENHAYIPFELIESRYNGKNVADVADLKAAEQKIKKDCMEAQTQARIDLARYITTAAAQEDTGRKPDLKSIRENRRRAQAESHIDFLKEGKHE